VIDVKDGKVIGLTQFKMAGIDGKIYIQDCEKLRVASTHENEPAWDAFIMELGLNNSGKNLKAKKNESRKDLYTSTFIK
jgi:hypothetical protein